MFRKLMAIETEAVRQHARDEALCREPTESCLMEMAEELVHFFPMPWHFGTCSSRHDF